MRDARCRVEGGGSTSRATGLDRRDRDDTDTDFLHTLSADGVMARWMDVKDGD